MNWFLLVAAILAVAAGFAIAVLASRRAVTTAAQLAAGTRIPRFVIGFTLLAIGTDLPEIANSIVSLVCFPWPEGWCSRYRGAASRERLRPR